MREYESYQVDLKLDKEELESHREEQIRIKMSMPNSPVNWIRFLRRSEAR